jgi:hypothetical protein
MFVLTARYSANVQPPRATQPDPKDYRLCHTSTSTIVWKWQSVTASDKATVRANGQCLLDVHLDRPLLLIFFIMARTGIMAHMHWAVVERENPLKISQDPESTQLSPWLPARLP